MSFTTITPALTVTGTVAVKPFPDVAVIVAVPGDLPVSTPASLIVATAVLDDVHATSGVSVCSFGKVPVGVRFTVLPAKSVAGFGATRSAMILASGAS